MPLVALDTNIVDLVSAACSTSPHVESMEAMEPPPSFGEMPTQLEAEVWATYWIIAMAPRWQSTVYTFSNAVYRELEPARVSSELFRIAWDVLVRDLQEPDCWIVQTSRRPDPNELAAMG